MLKKRNQKGFTLIEIIAVLVILGILAAVAVPKYMDLQVDSRKKAAQGFVAAAQASISMAYAANLLGNTSGPASPQAACLATTIDCASGYCNVTCDSTTWANTNIIANYGDQNATGNWRIP
jgi:prepilin-type N-terminal cleavage/methylation domain-containing protein